MTINDCIQELILFLKDNENSLAEKINVSTFVVFNVINLKRCRIYSSSAILEKILAINSENIYLMAEWLMRGARGFFLTNVSQSSPENQGLCKSIAELTNFVLTLQLDILEFRKTSTE
jgi:hypothetical protein